jgi:hypothetical protein
MEADMTLALLVIAAIFGCIFGLFIEHKFDVLTPERLAKTEAAIEEIRDRLRKI